MVADHLAGQLREQGWRFDTSWAGKAMAGSTWTRSDDQHSYAGTLDILSRGGSRFAVEFEMVELQ